ncbi:acyl carrier protein [Streptomyces sp. NPDC020800]|uniref:acyl carrier protein n=1 Tax=Streptomyces sp. NPDC020800 TaxID=3365092 RepID=UPI0037B8E682
MSTIRELLAELTGTSEYTDLPDDAALHSSGIDSGDLVRLVLLIEERTGAEITAADMEHLHTISDYEKFLTDHCAAGAPDGA